MNKRRRWKARARRANNGSGRAKWTIMKTVWMWDPMDPRGWYLVTMEVPR